jgi:hypothetical protein
VLAGIMDRRAFSPALQFLHFCDAQAEAAAQESARRGRYKAASGFLVTIRNRKSIRLGVAVIEGYFPIAFFAPHAHVYSRVFAALEGAVHKRQICAFSDAVSILFE